MGSTLTVELPGDLETALKEAGLTREQLDEVAKRYVAMALFRRHVLSLGQAADLAGMSLWDFIPFLGEHGIPMATYDADEIAEEVKPLQWPVKSPSR
jgi:predicted HTH domain antitoxin